MLIAEGFTPLLLRRNWAYRLFMGITVHDSGLTLNEDSLLFKRHHLLTLDSHLRFVGSGRW